MRTEIMIYNYEGTIGVRYRNDDNSFTDIEGLSPELVVSIKALIAHAQGLKTPAEKVEVALSYIKTSATDAQKLSMVELYPIWMLATEYLVGFELQYRGKLYRVVQAHTSQRDWTPDVVPALFKVVTAAGVIPNWIQPTGAHDAYALGAKVLFNSKIYESLIAANTYSPAAYPAGWKLIA